MAPFLSTQIVQVLSMNQASLIHWLERAFTDRRLDNAEKLDLRELALDLSPELKRFARNRAFELVRADMARGEGNGMAAVLWLEQVIKTLEATDAAPTRTQVHFSPGPACRSAILDCLHQARQTADICVFTIADDKVNDDGSDVAFLQGKGVPVRVDRTAYHMHHKFALFDGRVLLNGSFNWTRSASENNHENLVLTTDVEQVKGFARQFEDLWERFA
jgi:phosphatidylserine/phosphatidylglycerophosphate/cardiolipin synthase-like enzyme